MSDGKDKSALLRVLRDDGVELRDAGSYYVGLCPFHEDKTPSFFVYKNTGKYVCFGCSEKGDVIDYIRKSKGMSFSQAVKYLGIKYDKKRYIRKRPGVLDIIAEEEKCGINIEKKYGKDFIDRLLAHKLVGEANDDEP